MTKRHWLDVQWCHTALITLTPFSQRSVHIPMYIQMVSNPKPQNFSGKSKKDTTSNELPEPKRIPLASMNLASIKERAQVQLRCQRDVTLLVDENDEAVFSAAIEILS